MPDKHHDTEIHILALRHTPRSDGFGARRDNRTLVLVALLAAVALAGCGKDEGEAPSEASPPAEVTYSAPAPEEEPTAEGEPEPPNLRAFWEALVPSHPAKTGRHTDRVVIPLGPSGAKSRRKHLAGIVLPENPSKAQVRVYVGTILKVTGRRGMSRASDPVVEALAQVGPRHVDVLIEPLEQLPLLDGDMFVIGALKTLVTEAHKGLILKHLVAAPELVDVVVDAGWTRDAAPTLFKTLAKRNPYLNLGWIKAAASVAGPEHYEDLKFHLRHNGNHFAVWQAIRNLPGIKEIELSVMIAWRGTPKRSSHKWRQLAMMVAHYGHMEGLEFIVTRMGTHETEWKSFQRLTGYGLDIDIDMLWDDELKKARAWFAANKAHMEFDRASMRYVVRKP